LFQKVYGKRGDFPQYPRGCLSEESVPEDERPYDHLSSVPVNEQDPKHVGKPSSQKKGARKNSIKDRKG
jgi:hypothetical protein